VQLANVSHNYLNFINSPQFSFYYCFDLNTLGGSKVRINDNLVLINCFIILLNPRCRDFKNSNNSLSIIWKMVLRRFANTQVDKLVPGASIVISSIRLRRLTPQPTLTTPSNWSAAVANKIFYAGLSTISKYGPLQLCQAQDTDVDSDSDNKK